MKAFLAAVSLALVGVSIVVAAYQPGSPVSHAAGYLAFVVVWSLFIRSEKE